MGNRTYHRILKKKEKEEIERKLQKQLGIKKINGILSMRGQEKLFLFQGSLNESEIGSIEATVPVERVGVYFAKKMREEIKLSVEGVQILKDQIKENIFEINEEQMQDWMLGRDLNISSGMRGFIAIKYKNDLLGIGKASQEKIGNFIPKSRRLKEKN